MPPAEERVPVRADNQSIHPNALISQQIDEAVYFAIQPQNTGELHFRPQASASNVQEAPPPTISRTCWISTTGIGASKSSRFARP
jgi:hypothetical protein